MKPHAPFSLAVSATLGAALLVRLAAAQSGMPPPGARIAIVAYHDSRLFTLCPAFGEYVEETSVWTSGMKAKVTVAYPPTGQQSIGLHFEPFDHARAMLPLPATSPSRGSRRQPPTPGARELDRLARDIGVERRLAGQLRARKTYAVVESVADADVVFVAESIYVPFSVGTGDPPPRRESPASQSGRDSAARIFSDTEDEWNRRYNWREQMSMLPAPPAPAPPPPFPAVFGVIGGDRSVNWRQSILAVAVPAANYRQHAGDGEALAAAAVWSGLSVTGWGPRTGHTRSMAAASPEALVDRFHAKGSVLPGYLPVCAATAGTIRSIHDPAEPAGAQRVDETAPAAFRAAPDTNRPRFHSSITLVTVPVSVADREGRRLQNLPPSAFHVFEDGVEQKLERLDQGAVPADIALLVDTSASMRAVREAVRASAPALSGALRAADRAMYVTFDSRIRVVSELTKDASELQRALAQPAPGGGTRLYDALALVAVDRLGQVEGRKAAVLLTDGVDTRSQLTDAEGALAALETSNTPVFVVRYETEDAGAYMPQAAFGIRRWLIPPDGPEKAAEARAAADQFLARLSSDTGGRLLVARPDAPVAELLSQIGDELSSQLLLGYYPANDALDGTYRRITVTVDCAGCSVRARTGYRAGAVR